MVLFLRTAIFDWVTVAPLGVRTGAVRLGEGVRSPRTRCDNTKVWGVQRFFRDDVIFTITEQWRVAHSEIMANCNIRVIIYLFILV